MSCRFERRAIGEDLFVLSISGRITEPDVDTLRELMEQEKIVAIDLEDVLIVDRGAIGLLALRESSGTEIRNCPAYIREWVNREIADRHATEQRTGRKDGPDDS
jgi:hypothetical protein